MSFVEGACATFYAEVMGRPSLAPGRYFRLLLLGYFEGLDSERAIAWRAADSLSVRSFLELELQEPTPDHSTISRTRRLIDLETHRAVFTWVLQRLADAGLVKGTTIGIDATTLEANAALRSIVRRDTGETYQGVLTQLAHASGIETPTRDDLARLDRKRKKKGSNDDWTHPDDPDAKITKMKDHRTHLAHKAEHAVDLETGAVVAVTVQDADAGDTSTSVETLIEAAEQVETVVPDGEGVQEVVGDKGLFLADRPVFGLMRWNGQRLCEAVAIRSPSRNSAKSGAARPSKLGGEHAGLSRRLMCPSIREPIGRDERWRTKGNAVALRRAREATRGPRGTPPSFGAQCDVRRREPWIQLCAQHSLAQGGSRDKQQPQDCGSRCSPWSPVLQNTDGFSRVLAAARGVGDSAHHESRVQRLQSGRCSARAYSLVALSARPRCGLWAQHDPIFEARFASCSHPLHRAPRKVTRASISARLQ
jgi:transposase